MTPPTAKPSAQELFVLYEHPQESELESDKYVVCDDDGPIEPWPFVLIPEKDPHARVALAAYIESIRPHRPELAFDLETKLNNFR